MASAELQAALAPQADDFKTLVKAEKVRGRGDVDKEKEWFDSIRSGRGWLMHLT